MRQLFFVMVLLAGFAAIAVAARMDRTAHSDSTPAEAGAEIGPRPRIEFDSKTANFGSVPHGTEVKHVFKVRNAGDADLVLARVRSSCGCSAALPTKRRLAPGESCEITATFDTSKKPSSKERTKYTNLFFVDSNDRTQKDAGTGVTRLVLEGEVVSRFRLIPDSGAVVRGYRGSHESPAAATVTVVPLGSARFDSPRVLVAPAWASVTGPKPIERGGAQGLELNVSLKGALPLGRHVGSVVVATGDAEQKELVVPIQAHVLPSVQVLPSRIVAIAGQAPRPLTLVSRKPAKILGAEVVADDGLPAPLAIAKLPPEAGQRTTIALEAAPGVAPRLSTGTVRIFLADPESPVVEVAFILRDQQFVRSELMAQRAANVAVQPVEVYFGEVRQGTDEEQPIHISPVGPDPLALQDVSAEPAGLLEVRTEVVQGGRATRIFVRARGQRTGAISGFVKFRPRAGAPELKVPVFGRVVPAVAANPPALYLNAAEGGMLHLAGADGKTPRVLSVEDPAGIVEARIVGTAPVEARAGGDATAVEVRPKARPSGVERTELIVKLDDEDGEIRVPVFVEAP